MRSISLVLVCLWLSISLDSVAAKKKSVNQIVGGFPAKPGEFPFMAHLDIKKSSQTKQCGGTVIDNRHILTATHCVIDGPQGELHKIVGAKDVLVKLGCHDRWTCKREAHKAKKLYKVEKIMAHHKFGPELANDITLLRTDRDIEFQKHSPGPIGAVKLVGGDDTCCDKKGETLKVVGWGQLKGNVYATVLEQVDIKTLNHEQCKKNYPHINKVVLCAGDAKQGPCFGDSGGPLLRQLSNGTGNSYEQVAIFSFVEDLECVHPKGAGFTKVAPFLPWIKNCTTGGECKVIGG